MPISKYLAYKYNTKPLVHFYYAEVGEAVLKERGNPMEMLSLHILNQYPRKLMEEQEWMRFKASGECVRFLHQMKETGYTDYEIQEKMYSKRETIIGYYKKYRIEKSLKKVYN